MSICHQLEFSTSQEAWEKINEYFITQDKSLFEFESCTTSGMSLSYNVFLKIRTAYMDPEFDFGKLFNYKQQKWNSLISNYIDLNKLDLLRSKVRYAQSKYNQNYNYSYLFDNSHANGKGCLLSATFSRRFDADIPLITISLRASEITKRLAFDLLLVQRMGEYIYGNKQKFMINVFASQMFCNAETIVMYKGHKPIKKLIKQCTNNKWVDNLNKVLERIKTDPKSFKFKVFLRTAKCLNPEAFDHVPKPLLAKDLHIYEGEFDDIEFPENCTTITQRRKYLKKLMEQADKASKESNKKQ